MTSLVNWIRLNNCLNQSYTDCPVSITISLACRREGVCIRWGVAQCWHLLTVGMGSKIGQNLADVICERSLTSKFCHFTTLKWSQKHFPASCNCPKKHWKIFSVIGFLVNYSVDYDLKITNYKFNRLIL